MPRRLACLILAMLLAACGSSAGPAGDAGPTPDAGTQADAGIPSDAGGPVVITDGGCTPDGGCPSSGCIDISGAYRTCFTCPPPLSLQQGPFTTQVTHTCGCQVQGCVEQDGGSPQCGTGCIKLDGELTVTVSAGGFNVVCTGPYANGSADLTCPLGTFGSCTATLRTGAGTTCP